MVLRIQPHYHPMPKGDRLSRSEMAVMANYIFSIHNQNIGMISLAIHSRL